jgi:5-methyltetrahydropteroyltriglutamate--homocysteine methyltransferase
MNQCKHGAVNPLGRTTPPFRADHVGSLLRTAPLKQARAKRARQEIPADVLRQVEDQEIEKIVKKQEEVGLKLATDGEFRRSWWHFDFFRSLKGIEFYFTDQGIKFHGVDTKAESVRTVGKIGFAGHPHLDDFKFLKQHCRVVPKMTIPAPGVLHFRQGRVSVSRQVYPNLDAFFDDLGRAYRDAVQAFAAAGCRYLQLDDTTWAMMCDANERAQSRERGDDPDKLPKIYAAMINMALEGKPADMVVTMHSCRGNFRSTWIAEGGYEPVAEVMFNDTKLDGYFLEYDSDRAGGFEPLRFFPKGKKQLVLGLVTSKSGRLEPKDDIKRRIDEATKYVALEQLCISPQCGFASTEEGNVLAEDEQWAKLRMIVQLAEEVWGRS